MIKKVLKYVGITLAILAGLPLIVAPLSYHFKVAGVGDNEAIGLFTDLESRDWTIKDFNPFWINAIRVLVIAALVVGVVMLVIALLNDLKVLNLQGLEKILAVVLMVIGFAALVTVIVNQFANSSYETVEVLGESVATGAGLTANVMGWLSPVFALVGAGLVFVTVEAKKKGKKRK